jgi:ornithine carbamoyltransferase
MTRFGMDVTLAHPDGYDLIPEIVDIARQNAAKSGGNFKVTNDMNSAFVDADIVYPKSWAPFHIMEERTMLLKKGDKAGLEALEKKALAENAKHKDWECDDEKMKLTKEGNALYMHCLPADISGVSCKEGEVEADVFEKYRIRTYLEAGYKPYIIAAMMITNRFENPAEVLSGILKKGKKRVG